MARLRFLWGIRHLRWLWLRWRWGVWWEQVGRHLGCWPNPADWEYLDAVWRGEA